MTRLTALLRRSAPLRPLVLLLAVACSERTIEGTVVGLDGTGLSDVRIDLDPTRKHTRTKSDGTWSVHSPAGRYEVTASLDGHAPAMTHVVVGDEGIFPAPPLRLVPLPPSDGVWLVVDNQPAPLVRTQIERRTGERSRRYCLALDASEGATVPAGATSFVSAGAKPWRLFAVDADGCARTEVWETAQWRATSPDPLVVEQERVADAVLHTVTLDPGEYVLAPWSEQRFVVDAAQSDASGAKRYVAYRITAQ